jgi:Predicted permease
LADKPEFKNLDLQDLASKMNLSYSDIFKNVAGGVSGSLNGVMSTVGKVGIVLVLAPILLYYMLKDGHKFLPYLQRTILKNDRLNIAGLLKDLNNTIARYVSGASTDCFIVFVAVFIGYLIGGVPYAFLFATFSAITNLIPYIGPYIGVLPVVLIVAPENWVKALFAVLYVLAVQQIDGNFIYPKIVGNAMKIHPVTIMVLMLVMGNLYGLVGMLIAVPAYSIVKEIIRFIVEVYENHKHNKIVDKPKVSDKKN